MTPKTPHAGDDSYDSADLFTEKRRSYEIGAVRKASGKLDPEHKLATFLDQFERAVEANPNYFMKSVIDKFNNVLDETVPQTYEALRHHAEMEITRRRRNENRDDQMNAL